MNFLQRINWSFHWKQKENGILSLEYSPIRPLNAVVTLTEGHLLHLLWKSCPTMGRALYSESTALIMAATCFPDISLGPASVVFSSNFCLYNKEEKYHISSFPLSEQATNYHSLGNLFTLWKSISFKLQYLSNRLQANYEVFLEQKFYSKIWTFKSGFKRIQGKKLAWMLNKICDVTSFEFSPTFCK